MIVQSDGGTIIRSRKRRKARHSNMSFSAYPFLFRHAILPTLDRVNGTRVSQTHRFLEESQWFPRERLFALQMEKLEKILEFTQKNSSFYRQHWQSATDDRRATSHFPALDGMPIVTKDDLRAADGAFPIAGAPGGRVIKVKTSGSTGEPMTYLRSAVQDSWFWALRIRMWQWAGYTPGEPYLTLNLNARTAWHKRLQDVLFRCDYHGFNANQNDVHAVLRDLDRHKVSTLVGYSSSLYLLSQAMRRLGHNRHHVKGILATGDTLFPDYRQHIEETFNAGVFDYYGAGGEGFHVASQCEERGLYHLHIENSVIEILCGSRPAEPGEMGEVVVTQLDNHAMPLIRYATGDTAVPAAADAVCACGRQLPLIEGIRGRVPDTVFAPDGSALVVHFFTILFENLSGIRHFQIVQKEADRIVAHIVRLADFDQAKIEDEVRRAVDEATSGTLAVAFEYPDEIPLARSNKRRLVVSEIESGPFAVHAPIEDRRVEAPTCPPGSE
jgi:phenylacetate-CoA ligase